MHALPLLASLVDPYEILFRRAMSRPSVETRLGDEPNPEVRLFIASARREAAGPARPR